MNTGRVFVMASTAKRMKIKEFEDTKGQTEIITSEDIQDHGQQNETKDKQRAHSTI